MCLGIPGKIVDILSNSPTPALFVLFEEGEDMPDWLEETLSLAVEAGG